MWCHSRWRDCSNCEGNHSSRNGSEDNIGICPRCNRLQVLQGLEICISVSKLSVANNWREHEKDFSVCKDDSRKVIPWLQEKEIKANDFNVYFHTSFRYSPTSTTSRHGLVLLRGVLEENEILVVPKIPVKVSKATVYPVNYLMNALSLITLYGIMSNIWGFFQDSLSRQTNEIQFDLYLCLFKDTFIPFI